MRTGRAESLKSEINYVADLFGAATDGVVSAWKATNNAVLAPRLTAAVWPTVIGAAIGVLGGCLERKSHRTDHRVVACGLIGSALGFGAGVAWTSRAFTRAAARGAIRKVNAVRDAHWLEKNPIAYA
jgi:hypothetical protein